MKNQLKSVLLAGVSLAGLSGCAHGPVAPEARVDGAPSLPAPQVARLALHTMRDFPNTLYFWWSADVLTVDGLPVPKDTATLQMTPGDHIISYSCRYQVGRFEAAGVFRGVHSGKFNLDIGKLHYPSVSRGWLNEHHQMNNADCDVTQLAFQNPHFLP